MSYIYSYHNVIVLDEWFQSLRCRVVACGDHLRAPWTRGTGFGNAGSSAHADTYADENRDHYDEHQDGNGNANGYLDGRGESTRNSCRKEVKIAGFKQVPTYHTLEGGGGGGGGGGGIEGCTFSW